MLVWESDTEEELIEDRGTCSVYANEDERMDDIDKAWVLVALAMFPTLFYIVGQWLIRWGLI